MVVDQSNEFYGQEVQKDIKGRGRKIIDDFDKAKCSDVR